MAYAAVISLKQTIQRLLNSSHTPVVSSSREILESTYKHATFLQQFLKELYDSNNRSSSSKRWNADLDAQIKEAAQKVEDALEFNVSNHSLSLPQIHGDLDFEGAREDMNSFIGTTMKKMKDEYINEDDEDEDGAAVISSDNIDNFSVKMVGLSNEFTEIKDHLLKPRRPYDFGVFSLVGKVGSCRTIAAKALFDELYTGKEQPFDCGAWVSVGPNCQFKEILVNILGQIVDHPRSDQELGEDLYASLKGRKYMIVIDDIDDVEVWDNLRRLLQSSQT